MSTTERHQIGTCPRCGTTVWSNHPYAWCSQCGQGLPDEIRQRLASPAARSSPPRREEGVSLEVGGKQIPCPICGHDRYWTRKALMDTRGASFFGIDWANPTAENYICVRCGYVLWFMNR
jgi:ribosomal protein S27AE